MTVAQPLADRPSGYPLDQHGSPGGRGDPGRTRRGGAAGHRRSAQAVNRG